MGYCAICGQYRKLTFEHIPPQKALNNTKVNVYSLNEQLKRSEGKPAKFNIQQKGMGKHSLCKECNNNTGSWYGLQYSEMAQNIAYYLFENGYLEHGDAIQITTKNTEPLAFVKQVIAMFCSTLPIEKVRELKFDELLLDKENNEFQKNQFDLRMFISSAETGSYLTGMCAPVYINKDTNQYESTLVAEMGVYPFGFILNLDVSKPIGYGVSLMDLLNTTYGKEYEIKWVIPYLEKNSSKLPLPLQFKTLPESAILGELKIST